MIAAEIPYMPEHDADWPSGARELDAFLRKFFLTEKREVTKSKLALKLSARGNREVELASCVLSFAPSKELLRSLAWQLYQVAVKVLQDRDIGVDASTYEYSLSVTTAESVTMFEVKS